MNEAFIVRRGSGAGLNYKVVGGTTQPENPSENTIWVNTDVDITSHIFSATEPESPVEGMVWFNISTSCSAPINVLKKNTMMIYPTVCMQYVGGSWAVKEAKTYQNGVWVDWMVLLYDNGNQFESITGGWLVQNGAGGKSSIRDANIWLDGNGSSSPRDSVVRTSNKIYISPNATKLKMYIDIEVCNDEWGIQVGITDHDPGYTADGKYLAFDQVLSETGVHILEADISQFTGEYYVCLYASLSNGTVYKVWIE